MSASLEVFSALVRREDGKIDLARSCLLIAEDAYPGLDVEHYLAELERLAIKLRARLPKTYGAEERVVALNQFLFDDLGYRGNTEDYYDPRNSYLNEVMDRKTGIPITLAIVYMELGRRVGLPLEAFPSRDISWCACRCAAACWCSIRSAAGRPSRRLSCTLGSSASFRRGRPGAYRSASCRSTSFSSRRRTDRSWRACCAT